MFNKSIKLIVLTLLIFIFVFWTVTLAEQSTESFTASIPLPVPRVVTDRQFVLGLVYSELSMESFQRSWIQAQIEAEKRGWKLIANVDALTIDLQRNAVENLINQDVDAILVWLYMVEGYKDLVLKAREKGIGFYVMDETAPRDGVIASPTIYNGVAGAKMAYYGINRLKGVGNVLILNELGVVRERTFVAKGLIECGQWPNLNIVGFEDMKSPGWEKDSFDIAQNYLTKYNNDIQWIFAPWDTPGIFASRAVEEAGLTRDDLFITGIDGGTQAYAEIRSGGPLVATISQPFELFTHTIFEVINQVQIEGIAPGAPNSMIPDGRVIYLEPVLTTTENVPASGTNIHELFVDSYYDPNNKDAWYNWGEPYKIQ
jgi:ABC-type sugar transport system substrate-binding protein